MLVLPWLVYVTGRTLLGPYAGGSACMFFVDFLLDLADIALARLGAGAGPAADRRRVLSGSWRLAAPAS